jgi:CMP-N,N'-diacetyllegionaminic acid synthase
MNILVTICIRKGSKRLENKNIRQFCGKPLFEWTFLHAKRFKESRSCDNVTIALSTDYREMFFQKYLQVYCVNYNKRDHWLCGDGIDKLKVIRDLVRKTETNINKYDVVIDLDVTSPLRKRDDVQKAFDQFLLENNCQNLFSVTTARKKPWFDQVFRNENRIATEFYCIKGDVHDLNASIYIYKRKFLDDETIVSPIVENSSLYLMDDWQFIDIDTEDDWDIAEMFFKKHIHEIY